jgi:light-regulated signal transduction histidine kinase (bacteriophytochrome)
MTTVKQEYLDDSTTNLLLTLSYEAIDKLQLIGAYAALLSEMAKKQAPSSEQRKWLDDILSETSKGTALIRDIRNIIEVLGIFEQIEPQVVDLSSIVQGIIRVWLNTGLPRQVHLDLNNEDVPCLVNSPAEGMLHRALELTLGCIASLTPDDDVLQIRLNVSEEEVSLFVQGVGVKRFSGLSPVELSQSLLDGMPSVGASINLAQKIISLHGGNFEFDNLANYLTINLPLAP